jgi:aminoglycoside phosphotransferase (APT) family kinase protein
MHDDRLAIDAETVRRLVAAQFPAWADLPVRAVRRDGWDNSTFRLGAGLKARLPTAARYVAQVGKEFCWLPRLAPQLPLPIPRPLALGAPGEGYPFAWSVQDWLAGEPASAASVADEIGFARDLAGFLRALQAADTADAPPPGAHNFHRGGQLAVYDPETRGCLARLDDADLRARATAAWEAALAAAWEGRAVWTHGDVAAGNLLVAEGRLAAVIDFGNCAVGDPACDLTIAWTFLGASGRAAFREAMGADRATWLRARGWAVWKALLALGAEHPAGDALAPARAVVDAVLGEAG